MTATIAKIIHWPLPSRPQAKFAPSSPGIVLCRIQQHWTPPNTTPCYTPDQLFRVVFSLSHLQTAEHFKEGQTVRIYRPWHEISPPIDDGAMEDQAQPHLPASLPLPSSEPNNTPDILDARINETVLVCSRFMI